MKILELSLQAFGPFTDVTLDFSGGHEGLHLVYGPNEAGKSSALRGLRQALFGFPVQSSDDFLHSYQKMRVGLRLRDGDGQELAFVRRKGAKNTLLAADGSSPMPDSALARLLGGMTEAEFSRRFALDHDELVAGGKSILEGAGELGQILFQAGGGLKDLLEVRRGLDRELEALFKPSGTRPRINAGLGELKEAKAQVREGSLPSTEWVEHDTAHRRAARELEEVERRLESIRAEKRRLERIADALPVLARRRQYQQEWDALGPVVLLPEDFTEARHQAASQLESARTAERTAEQAIAELDAQIEALVVPEDLLEQADAIERLRDALAGYRKAQDALPSDRTRLQLLEAEIREILAELRPAAASPAGVGPSLLETADALRPSRSQKAAISRLSADLARLTAEQDHADAEVARLAARLESEQAELDRIEAPGDPEPLAIAMRQARDQGDLDAQVAAARARLDQADAEAARALAQLPLRSGTLDEAVNRPVPPAETVDRFEAESAEIDAELARLRSAREAADAEAADAGSKLSELRDASGVLPTEDDLIGARARRDRIWRPIRRAVETGRPPSAEEVLAALDADDPGGLASAFERSVQEADVCADRLRREAERVAAQAGARAALDRARLRLAGIEDSTRQAAARADDVRSRWRDLWRPMGIEPLSPREMRGWLQMWQGLVQKAGDARARRAELEALRTRSAAHRAAIGRALAALGEDAAGTEPGSSTAIDATPLGAGLSTAIDATPLGAGLPTPPPAGPKVSRSDRTGSGRSGRPSGGPRAGSETRAQRAGLAGDPGEELPTPSSAGAQGPPDPGPLDEALGPIRDRAEAVLARLGRIAARRDELLQSIGQTRRQLELARAGVRAAGDRLGAWRESWARAVSPLGLPPEAAPEQADAVLEQATTLAARIKEAREARARIDDSEREAGQFAGEVRAMGRLLAAGAGDPPSDPAAIAAAAQDLIRRLAAARQAADRRDALRLRRDQQRAAVESARRDREAAETRLALLCRDAGRASPDDLPAAERASAAARRIRDRMQELDQQLGRLCGHEPLESFRAAAMAVDVDRLPDRLAALDAEIVRLDGDRERLIDERATRRTKLDSMDGEGRAAEANERVEHLKSRLAHEVEEYARLRLASVVLREAIERYRHRTQGPVLDRAGALFAALTLGSFRGLKVEYDDRDQPMLQAVRPDGAEAVGIRGLSLGTADQLYLALRLASLETALESQGPVPLIADDILIQFDDLRTAAALRLLAGLSDRAQIILFTHHEHVCELARSALPPDRLFIHRLPGRVA